MLVLSRKTNERIILDDSIRITVLGIRGHQVRLGIEAPGHVRVIREELLAEPTEADRPESQPETAPNRRAPIEAAMRRARGLRPVGGA